MKNISIDKVSIDKVQHQFYQLIKFNIHINGANEKVKVIIINSKWCSRSNI